MRLPPLPADQWDEAVQRSLSVILPAQRCNPRDAGNALSTFANHPALAKAFLRFNTHLLFASTLPARVRELAILRVAHRRACAYEWTHHLALAEQAGISGDEIAAVRRGEATDDFERAVLTGVDELDENSELSDQTWAALGEHLDDRQRMDYVFTVGCYALLAMAFNTFGVQLEELEQDHAER
ncbi:carboxymuconolactone decarboxylase family protein [Mycobacterium marinum]|uniref:carboxymuconolactone decarboxylase family protein n=1 Tax=Mycobacterium marinum TaxID=1781 RepID=UPI002358C7BC|nr:carboxymuconolactone decarboxylase family protein [Mycobacterium marinum]MDC8973624.1 carboxymuconolactone decarboxylase family protein [Mycobacterium marinum]